MRTMTNAVGRTWSYNTTPQESVSITPLGNTTTSTRTSYGLPGTTTLPGGATTVVTLLVVPAGITREACTVRGVGRCRGVGCRTLVGEMIRDLGGGGVGCRTLVGEMIRGVGCRTLVGEDDPRV